jgi:hypothetical protein
MTALAPERAAEIRRKGLRYFSKVNYGFASHIASPLQRYATYWLIYRSFGFRYSPLEFRVYGQPLKELRRVVRKVRRVLHHPKTSAAA